MKSILSLAFAAFLFGTSSSSAAILFTGGTGGSPVVLTVDRDIVFPITTTLNGNFGFGFVLKNVYSQFTGFGAGYPQTPITSPGAVTASLIKSGGVTIPLTDYQDFGQQVINFAGMNDFSGSFYFDNFANFAPGDQLVIRAGSITLPSWVPLPNQPVVTTLYLVNDNMEQISGPLSIPAIPEASTAVLGAATAMLLFRRKRH